MALERDPRKLFAGDDPGRRIREGAADWLKRAEQNGLRREHEARKFIYDATPELVVRISRVRHEPPLWRLEATVEPIGKIVIDDADDKMLVPELRHRVARLLPQANPSVLRETARKLSLAMRVRTEYVLLRDSQRHWREGNGPG